MVPIPREERDTNRQSLQDDSFDDEHQWFDDDGAAVSRTTSHADPFSLSHLLGLDVPYPRLDDLEKEISALQNDKPPPTAQASPTTTTRGITRESTSTSITRKRIQSEPHNESRSKRPAISRQYQDHANDPLAPTHHPKSGTFPFILHQLLEEASEIGLSSIISWRPHGRAFMVHDTQGFVQHVMPLYFKQTQMPSFLRQLSLYGFTRIHNHTMEDCGSYFHEYFLRGRQDLCTFISRVKNKRRQATRATTTLLPEQPNFYKMTPVGMCVEKKNTRNQDQAESESIWSSLEQMNSSHEPAAVLHQETRQVNHDVMKLEDRFKADFEPTPLPPMFDSATVATIQSSYGVSQQHAFVTREGLSFHVLGSALLEPRAATMSAVQAQSATLRNKISNAPYVSAALNLLGRGKEIANNDPFLESIGKLFEHEDDSTTDDDEDSALTSFLSKIDWS